MSGVRSGPNVSVLIMIAITISFIVALFFLLSRALEGSTVTAVILSSESANEDISRVFVNELGELIQRDLGLTHLADKQPRPLEKEPLSKTDNRIRSFMRDTDILKIKLYNLDGITVYSSDFSQLGANYLGEPGFESALRGVPYSESNLRSEFEAYEGKVFNRDIVSSYVPLRVHDGFMGSVSRVIGVAELYTDRTEQLERARAEQLRLNILLGVSFLVLTALIAISAWLYAVRHIEKYIQEAEKPL